MPLEMRNRAVEFDDVLNEVASGLDIPPHKYKLAMNRFDAIKRHLRDGDYSGSAQPPEVYLQGSFRLGTVIRPVKTDKDCEFDIDIVCQVDQDKDDIEPETLKNEVGKAVKGYASAHGLDEPKNGKRCWSLTYAPDPDGTGFHVDVLPCLPDETTGGQIRRMNRERSATAWEYTRSTIAITNRDGDAESADHDWRSSNPAGFAKWFLDICKLSRHHVNPLEQKAFLFESFKEQDGFEFESPDEIPDEVVRTPLQQAIQIMKRHRDLRFSGRDNEKDRPISMIITTLAARLYEARAAELTTTQSTLTYIVDTLTEHAALVEGRALREAVRELELIQHVGGRWYIPNPVNPQLPGDPEDKGENFADRWDEENHAKARAFFQWVEWLQEDLGKIIEAETHEEMEDALQESFGEFAAHNVSSAPSGSTTSTTSGSVLRSYPSKDARFDVTHCVAPPWPESRNYDVTISGRFQRYDRWHRFSSDSEPIPKYCPLRFSASTDVPPPFTVHWQVVNTGPEAEKRGQLRGEIEPAKTAGTGGLIKKDESTEYTGSHWIECFIVKDGILVARSGEFVVNIK